MYNNFAESDRILDQIRYGYDTVAEYLPKAIYLKRAFEDRYLEALKKNTDLVFFLKGEQQFLERFLAEAQAIKDRKDAYQERNEDGFVESVFKEIQSSTLKYTPLKTMDSRCTKEVTRLYGGIRNFMISYWDSIAYYMRGISSELGVEIDRLERSLSDVYSISEERLPKSVEFYNDMIRRSIGTNPERIRAAQDAIQLAGIWLNNLHYILETTIGESEEAPPQDIRVALTKLFELIQDFRLLVFTKRRNEL